VNDGRRHIRNSTQRQTLLVQADSLVGRALKLIDAAEQFYKDHFRENPLRVARASYIRAHVFSEKGDFDAAERESRVVAQYGEQLGNDLLLARANVLFAMIAIKRFWAGGVTPDAVSCALSNAEAGVSISERTGDRRLIVKANTWHAFAHLLRTPCNLAAVADSLATIQQHLLDMPDDYVTQDVDVLRKAYDVKLQAGATDVSKLLAAIDRAERWGELLRLFKELVFSRMLAKNEYKVKVVADLLKCSPKLVRRVAVKYRRLHNKAVDEVTGTLAQ
jgi:hypothetical protein